MFLALCHKLKRLKSFLSKRAVITMRESHKNALNSLVAKSLRSSEEVWRWVLLHDDVDMVLD